jgi:hypothetical protein
MSDDRVSVPENQRESEKSTVSGANEGVVCPVCGEVAVQEKCKIICRSEKCRGRVILNCSEF